MLLWYETDDKMICDVYVSPDEQIDTLVWGTHPAAGGYWDV